MSSPDYSAEIDRMLGGAGNDPAPGAPPPDQQAPAPGQAPGQVVNPGLGEHGYPATSGIPQSQRTEEDPRYIAMRDQLRAAQEEIGALKARPPLPTQEGTVAQPPQNVEELKRNLETAFLKDPGGTLLSLAGYLQGETQKAIDAAVQKGNAGIRSDLQGGNVEAYRQKMMADPLLAPAVDEFDKLIRDVGPNLQPGNMSKQLDALASTALGNTMRSRLPGSRQTQPPAWGGGLTASADSGQPAGAPQTKLSSEQEEYVRTMAELGLPKEVIAERLKSWDHEGGFSKP